uniref:Uncharacterized protein n=1 Tax=Candidatus Kentrum sp. LFY TaxID=2126342 RepID=A0A450UEY1_9GAMM|nr:MAG: hypothetical protein BECKLFY1418B_GA0070995_102329 [Candidatus Kentron sp. LFY]
MKVSLLIMALFMVMPTQAWAEKQLKITEVSGSAFQFDYKKEYLDINIVALFPPPTNAPSWWDRLWGKETSFGLISVEYNKGTDKVKIPLFSYSAKSSSNYEIDSVGVLENAIVYPIIRRLAYFPSGKNDVKVTVHYWEDKKKADFIKSLINAAQLLGGMDASSVDKALDISTTVVSLIEKLWPTKNQKQSIKLSLLQGKINKNTVTFGYAYEDGSNDPVLTLGYAKKKGYFVDSTFGAGLNEYRNEQLDVWKGSISEVDNNVGVTGVGPVFNQLSLFSAYAYDLPLNYADKVLLVANAIENWAGNSVAGVTDEEGNIHRLKMTHYRKLKNSD